MAGGSELSAVSYQLSAKKVGAAEGAGNSILLAIGTYTWRAPESPNAGMGALADS